MARRKPSLKKALKKVDDLPKNYFGQVNIDVSSLPCIAKPKKEKITATFDVDLLLKIKKIAKKHNVSYASLMNDTLREIFIKNKKTG